MTTHTLTQRQLKFCESYLANGRTSAEQAAKDAGYSTKHWGYAARLLTQPPIKEYLEERIKEQAIRLQVTFDDKVKKLKQIIELCVPDDAKSWKDMLPTPAISAIAELNKMQGHYSAEKHMNVNANVTLDPNLKKVTDLLEDLRKKYERDY